MRTIKIVRHGCNYIVAFEDGAVRHFYGSEEQFAKWLAKKSALTF